MSPRAFVSERGPDDDARPRRARSSGASLSAFVNLLNEVRIARLSPATVATIRSLSRPLPDSDDSCPPTELYPKRSQVDDANEVHLRRLDGPSHHYEARDGGSANDEERARLLKSFMAPALLELKVGAQVMLVKNVDAARGLCNGAIGVVTAFRHAPSGPDFRSAASDYAVSGTELIKVDGGRVRKGKAFSGHSSELFPVVRFFLHSGISTVLVKKDEFTAEDKNGRVLARRVQVSPSLSRPRAAHRASTVTSPGTSRSLLGDLHPQEPGADPPARDRGRERVRPR